MKNFVIILSIALLMLSCSKDDEVTDVFNYWIKSGNYSVYKCTEVISQDLADSIKISIMYREKEKDFQMEYTYYGGVDYRNHVGDDCYVTIGKDGLYKGTGCGFFSNDELLVPANPYLNQSWEKNNCYGDILGKNTVVELNKIITVPAGTFNTFVIQDTDYNRNIYYNDKYGIIKLESIDSENQNIILTFVLVEKNF